MRHVQRQPRETRANYALLGAIVTTAMIAVAWGGYIAAFPNASSYTASLNRGQAPATTVEQETATAPFSGFWSQLKEQAGALRSIGAEVQEEVSRSEATEPNPAPDERSTEDNITITHTATRSSTSSAAAATSTATSSPQEQP